MLTDSRVNWKIIQAKRFTSSSEVGKPTFSTRNCLQRSLIGKHSNCIVWPLEAVLKETNNYFEDSKPFYVCDLASTERDAIWLFLMWCVIFCPCTFLLYTYTVFITPKPVLTICVHLYSQMQWMRLTISLTGEYFRWNKTKYFRLRLSDEVSWERPIRETSEWPERELRET